MEVREYKKMEDYEKDYWWHRGKINLIEVLYENFLPDDFKERKLKILEIGCGTGEVLKLLSKWGKVKGIDFSQEALDACTRKGFNDLICGDINEIDFKNEYGTYDLIVSFDVLEHILDDVKTMKLVKKLLKPGGYFFLSVPAYKFLWSTHDEALHHRRRYHSLEIKTKMRDSGYRIVKYTHFVAFLFFPIAFVRLMANFVRRTAYPKTHYVMVPKKINEFFITLLKLEATMIKKIYLPFGTTLVMVAKNEK